MSDTAAPAFNFKNAKQETIPLSKILESTESLRPVVEKDTVEYKGLVESVRQYGVMQPILVRPLFDPLDGTPRYGLIDGLHRYNAAMDAGLSEIPAQISTLDEGKLIVAQIVANAQRIETTRIQYMKGLLKVLAADPTMTVTELCAQINKEVAWFYKNLGLLKLSKKIQQLVEEGTLTVSNAHTLSQFDEAKQEEFLQSAISKSAVDFGNQATAALKEIKKAKDEGRKANIDVFAPVAKLRRLPDIRDERDALTDKPEVSKLAAQAREAGVTGLEATLAFALNYAMHLDPATIIEQKKVWEDERKASAEKAEKLKKEREAKKQAKNLTGVAP